MLASAMPTSAQRPPRSFVDRQVLKRHVANGAFVNSFSVGGEGMRVERRKKFRVALASDRRRLNLSRAIDDRDDHGRIDLREPLYARSSNDDQVCCCRACLFAYYNGGSRQQGPLAQW